MDPSVKAEAEAVFAGLGLSASQAITLFYRQVTLAQARARQDLTPFDSVADLMATADDLDDGPAT